MTPELIAAIVAALTALATFLKSHTDTNKINNDRAVTKHDRDTAHALLEQRVRYLEQSQTSLADSIRELQASIVKLQISVNELVIEIKHKEDK